jgi:hypothetical protein
MKPLLKSLSLQTPKPRTTASVQDGESTIIESVYDDDSYYIEEIVETDDDEIIEEIVEDSDDTFDDSSSGAAFDDGSSVALESLMDSEAPMYNKQDEMNRSAVFEGTRKAMEEELERDKSRARQAGLEALRQRRLEQEAERLGEKNDDDASHIEETEEDRQKRQEAVLLKQKEQDDDDEDAHKRLAEEIKRVDVALSKKRDTLTSPKLPGPDHVEKRKRALAELRRQAARQELARNNDALKATRASRGGAASVASQTSADHNSFRPTSVPSYQKCETTPSPTGTDSRNEEHASVPENADSVDIFLRTPARLSPLQFGGALTPVTASKLDFGNATSPYSRMETPENKSEAIEQDNSAPRQSLMNNNEKEDETNIDARMATAKHVEAEPAINTEDAGNMTDQALVLEKKAVDETEELIPSERQEVNSMADAAQDDGSTGSSNTERQPGLQKDVETPVPMMPTSDSVSKLVPPKSTSSVLPKAADPASSSTSEETTVRSLPPEGASDTERSQITSPKNRMNAPKTTDSPVMPTAITQINDSMPSDWDEKYHTIDDLRLSKIPGLDNTRREKYLSPEDFQEYFKLTKEEFAKFPKWKRDKAKRKLGLF